MAISFDEGDDDNVTGKKQPAKVVSRTASKNTDVSTKGSSKKQPGKVVSRKASKKQPAKRVAKKTTKKT